jgi:hypothetical protein
MPATRSKTADPSSAATRRSASRGHLVDRGAKRRETGMEAGPEPVATRERATDVGAVVADLGHEPRGEAL